MKKHTLRMFAMLCIEMMLFFPILHVYALSIYSPTTNVSTGSITVSWSTSTASNATVLYKLYSSMDAADYITWVDTGGYKVNHSMTLTDLEGGSRYSYEITAMDQGSNVDEYSGYFTFPDSNPPPQITGLTLVNSSADEIEIEWEEYNTSEITDFDRYYIYRNNIFIDSTTSNSYTDDNITGFTTYTYTVAGHDDSGNIGAMSDSIIVTTPSPDTSAPNLYNVRAIGLSNTSMMIIWTTDESATSAVYYGTSTLNTTQSSSGYHTNHTVTLNNLAYRSTYQYKARSCDRKNNCRNSSQLTFVAGGDTTPPSLDVDIPEEYNANLLPINGTTDALARILIYLNGASTPNVIDYADIDGNFATSIQLDTSLSQNTLLIKAMDYSENYVEESFTIHVDATKPVVTVTSFPALSLSSSISINGTVSEDVTMDVYITYEEDSTLGTPSQVTGLANSSVSSSAVSLSWTSLNSSESIKLYRIYRNGVVVGATTSHSYSDCVHNSTSYTYQVSAVNDNCVEGPMSDTISVYTGNGSSCTTVRALNDGCLNATPVRTVTLNNGSFRQSIPLKEGTNDIRLVFSDDVGNSVEVTGTTIYDKKAPSITRTNLAEITPSYEDTVTVNGTVDEQATVTIYVNNDTSFEGVTNASGFFSIEIELDKLDFNESTSTSASSDQVTGMVVDDTSSVVDDDYRQYLSGRIGNGTLQTTSLTWSADDGVYRNQISIIAVDAVGRNSTPTQGYIEYKMCSYGTWWAVNISEIQPSMLIPRHLLNGIAQITFNWDLQWLGGTGASGDTIPRVTPSFKFRTVAPADRVNWDRDWFASISTQKVSNTNNTVGWVIIQSKALNRYVSNTAQYRRNLARAITTNSTENFTTTLEMENNISAHRKGSDWTNGTACRISQFGCVRLPIQLELQFTDPAYVTNDSNTMGYTSTSGSSGHVVQRQCIDLEVAIDQRVDTDIIPESFLRSAIKFLNSSINFIDSILKPLNKIKEYTLYACLGSWVYLYVKALQMKWTCEFGPGIKKFVGMGFKTEIAEQGLCNYFYYDKGDEKCDNPGTGTKCEVRKECNACKDKVKSYKNFEETMHNICDRIMCISAPSFVSYVKTMTRGKSKDTTYTFTEKDADGKPVANSESISLTLRKQSDCKDFPVTLQNIETAYAFWKRYKDGGRDAVKFKNPYFGTDSERIKLSPEVSCYEPHAYNPNCCVVEYMRKYDSVCGLSGALLAKEGFLFDEMQESYCVAMKYNSQVTPVNTNLESPMATAVNNEGRTGTSTASNPAATIAPLTAANYEQECNNIVRRAWNAFASICEKDPSEEISLVKTGIAYDAPKFAAWNSRPAGANSEQQTSNDPFATKTTTTGKTISTYEGSTVTSAATTVPSAAASDARTPSIEQSTLKGCADRDCPKNLRQMDQNEIFYRIVPENVVKGTVTNSESPTYKVQRGYVSKNVDLTDTISGSSTLLSFEDFSPVGSSDVFIPIEDLETEWFQENKDQKYAGGTSANEIMNTVGYQNFKLDLECCASKGQMSTLSSSDKQREYDKLTKFINDHNTLSREDLIKLQRGTTTGKANPAGLSYINDNTFEDVINNKAYVTSTPKVTTSGTATVTTTVLQVVKDGKNNDPMHDYLFSTETKSYVDENTAKKIYKDIQAKMGLVDKEIIVDPTSGFLRSVQCLCLTAVTGYLKLWRAIMVAVKACLQTILITGDGNPGVCRAVLTQYICDLIYDVIKCFANRMSSGTNGDERIEGSIGNALATLTSAGRTVERSISSRYGDSGLFRALFAERQLVHAVCLFAFTGTFDFDFSSLTEGEYGDIPVDSQGLLSPCQRRYISYNTATGKTSWNYYFGVGLVAGSDLTYQIKLQCSDGFDCDYGYGNERCDCAGKGNQYKTLSLSSNAMSKYDVLETEMDKTLSDESYRYDKVLLEYTYTDKDRDRVTKNISCSLRSVGGNPPGFCQYDLLQGYYRCSVSAGLENYVILTDATTERDEYLVGEQVKIRASVSQKLPETLECTSPTSCEYTKFLAVEITDNHGSAVNMPDDGYVALLNNGALVYSVPPEGVVIETSSVSPSTSLACSAPASTFVSLCTGTFNTATDTLVITATVSTATPVKYTFTGTYGSANAAATSSPNPCTITSPATTATCSFKIDQGRSIGANLRTNTGSSTASITSGTSVTLTPRAAATTGCASGSTYYWNGKATIYEGKDNGQGIYGPDYSNIYQYNGQDQSQSFQIKIKCNDVQTTTTLQSMTFADMASVTPTPVPTATVGQQMTLSFNKIIPLSQAGAKIYRASDNYLVTSPSLYDSDNDGTFVGYWNPQSAGQYNIIFWATNSITSTHPSQTSKYSSTYPVTVVTATP